MAIIIHILLCTTLFAFLSFFATVEAQDLPTPTRHATKPPIGPPVASPALEPSTEQPAMEAERSSANLHCFQCEGESTDPDDHCTDSGWISIPRTERLAYRFLCPKGVDDFCIKTIERWESTRPGVADKFRTKRGCSAKTRTSQQISDKQGAGVKFTVSNGCTDSRKNPTTGAYVQMCFCDKSLCNTGVQWGAPSVQPLMLLPLAAAWL